MNKSIPDKTRYMSESAIMTSLNVYKNEVRVGWGYMFNTSFHGLMKPELYSVETDEPLEEGWFQLVPKEDLLVVIAWTKQ